MQRRLVRASLAAVRRFSAEAAVVVPDSPPVEGGQTSIKATAKSDSLGWRIFSLGKPRLSAVVTLKSWKEEGRQVKKYQLSRIVRELRKHQRYKHALEVCEWMRLQPDIKLLSGDYALHLDLVAKVRGLNSAEKFFEDLPHGMKDQLTCTALLHTYVQNKLSTKAEGLFSKMKESGIVKSSLPYNHMISLYISMGWFEKVPGVLQELKKNASPDIITYNLLLAACASENDVEAAEKLILDLKKAGIEPQWQTYGKLTSIYLQNDLKDKAKSTLYEMEKRISKVTRNAYLLLLSQHTRMGNKSQVNCIWKKMKSSFKKMSDNEYHCMIDSLVKLNEVEAAKNLYSEWLLVSPTKDSRVSNLILAAYVNTDMGMAEKCLEQMIEKGIKPSYPTWVILIRGYLKEKRVGNALGCFEKAVGSVKKWDPDEKILKEICSILEGEGNTEGAEKLLATLRQVSFVDTQAYNSLLRTYLKAGKMPPTVAERMKDDNVAGDEETQKLISQLSNMCVSEIPSSLC